MKTKWKLMAALIAVSGMAQAAFVTIGDAGNAADTADGDPYTDGVQRYGAVAYTYQISKYEVTIAEFTPSGAGNGNEDGYYSLLGPNAPAVNVSLYEARKYCNWLNTGNIDSGYYGAGGTNMSGLSHDAYAAANGLTYFVPTEDEWYKAAYYTGNSGDLWSLYAHGTDTHPPYAETADGTGWSYSDYSGMWVSGGSALEQNGTHDMMGNAWERMENGVFRGGEQGLPGGLMGSGFRYDIDPLQERYTYGFRVVAIPEPATALSLVLGGLVITGYRRLRKSYGHF